MDQNIRAHFEEAQKVLTAFLADDQLFENVERAGQAMVDSIKKWGEDFLLWKRGFYVRCHAFLPKN